jgi:hypothetical protein
MLETMKELFGVAHIRDDKEEVPNVKRIRVVEEEVPVSQGPSVTVPPKGRECLVTVNDNVLVPSLVSSSPFFFLKNAGDSFCPFSHKCGRFVG